MRPKRQPPEDEEGADEALYKLITKDDYSTKVLAKDYIRKILARGLAGTSARYRNAFADRVHSLSRVAAMQFQHIHFVYNKAPRSEWIQRSLNWERQQTERCRLLETSAVLRSWNVVANTGESTGEVLVAYNQKLLLIQCVSEITKAMEEFQQTADLKSINRTRHDRDTLFHGLGDNASEGLAYLALWQEQGHPEKGTRISSNAICTVKRCNAVSALYKHLEGVTASISAFLCAIALEIWADHQGVMNNLVEEVGHLQASLRCGPTDCFNGRALIFNSPTRNHRDARDHGLAAMIVLGEYPAGEGELVLPELKIRLAYCPGDVVLLDAGALVHFVTPWSGRRLCIVHFMQEKVRLAAKRQ